MADNYGAEAITVLEGLEAVRKRPGMYIGSTSSRGLHHLVWEIVDNSVDEALAGVCDKITVKILEGNIIEVSDNGRGIPVDRHKKGISAECTRQENQPWKLYLQYCMLAVNLTMTTIKCQVDFMELEYLL